MRRSMAQPAARPPRSAAGSPSAAPQASLTQSPLHLSALSVCPQAIETDTQAALAAAANLPKPLTRERISWAHFHVRSRALRFQVKKAETGEAVFSKCLVPVVDMMNHCSAPLSRVPAMRAAELKLPGAAAEAEGPGVRVEFDGGGARWLADRTIRSGEEVTWTYGSLSNSDLFLQYGFVPAASLHGDARVEFTLPGFLFEQSLQALSGAHTLPALPLIFISEKRAQAAERSLPSWD